MDLAAGNQLPVCQVFALTVDVVDSNVPIVAGCRTSAHSKKEQPAV